MNRPREYHSHPPYALVLLAVAAGVMLGLMLAIPPWPQAQSHGPVEVQGDEQRKQGEDLH